MIYLLQSYLHRCSLWCQRLLGPTKAEMRRKKNCCFLMMIHTPYGHLILFSFHYFNEFRKILILIFKKQYWNWGSIWKAKRFGDELDVGQIFKDISQLEPENNLLCDISLQIRSTSNSSLNLFDFQMLWILMSIFKN